jgi:hypothetical protein
MKKPAVFIIILLIPLIVLPSLHAGSSDMVENRVDELDKLNKEAVKQVAGQPEKGTINLKVRAIPGKDGYKFEPIEKDDAPYVSGVFLNQENGDKIFTLREGITRLVKNKPGITPYRNYGNEGEYISFKDAIIRLNRSKEQ